MGTHITDFVGIPEDFIIEDHMTMRERMGFFKYPKLISLETINKTNAVIKTTGYLKISTTFAEKMQEEMQSIASAAAYLMCLDELGLIVTSFKRFSFETLLWKKSKQEGFESFIKEVERGETDMTIHIVNIFPLIQNGKYYLADVIKNLLILDDIDLDRQAALIEISELD